MDYKEEYGRIKNYIAKTDTGNYTLDVFGLNAIIFCSGNAVDMVWTAFQYGFEKGCRKTKKAVKA